MAGAAHIKEISLLGRRCYNR